MPTTRLEHLASRLAADGADARALRDDDLVAALAEVGELRRLVDAAGTRLAAELAERCEPRGAGTPDARRGLAGPVALVEATAGLDRVEASAWIRVGAACAGRVAFSGQALPSVRPLVADAVTSGVLSVGAASRIVRALDDASEHVAADRVEAFEAVLVDAAPDLSDRELRSLCRRVGELVDPDGVEPAEDELRRRSSVTIRQCDDGLTRVTALLHPEAAAYLITALDARTAPRRQPAFPDRIGDTSTDDAHADDRDTETDHGDGSDRLPDPPEDHRPLANRRADALAAICRDALAHDTGHLAGTPVTVLVTMTLDQLTNTGPGHAGAVWIAGIDQPVSAGTARRLAANAEVIPTVLGSRSEPLDQGRSTRLATPAQRRALALRDQGCIWGRCDAPPAWCEIAHLKPWAGGGPTNLDNLALMCPHHHRLYDRDDWTLQRRPDGRAWLITPPHLDPARTPRRAGPTRLHDTVGRDAHHRIRVPASRRTA